MNTYTKEIASFLKISIEDAMRVQDEMEIYHDIRFSEASTRKFRAVAKEAAADLGLI